MSLSLNNLVVECVKNNSGTKLAAKEIAQWIFEHHRSGCEEKRCSSKQNLTKDTDLIQQISAEIAANRPVIQRKNHARQQMTPIKALIKAMTMKTEVSWVFAI